MVRIAAKILLVLALVPIVLVPVYAVLPPVSTLMLARWLTLRPVVRDWTPLGAMGPYLPRAVVAAEDAGFCAHRGVDWGALRDVLGRRGGPSRGASTIAMQTAKNLFLWQGAAWLRKPIEIVLALWIDLVWSKRRLLEVYLNVAEWGPGGVFGAEAGARRAFGRGAAALTPRQAALLAAALPNPVERNPGRPSRAVLASSLAIERRAKSRAADFGCLGPTNPSAPRPERL